MDSMIFDTHAHYDDPRFDEDRETLLAGMAEAGVSRIVNISASIPECRATLELTRRYPFLYGAVGVHPDEVAGLSESDLDTLRQMLAVPKIVAVGEIGLDYFEGPGTESDPAYAGRAEEGRALQKEWFARQLRLAEECRKPVLIHSRDAAQDTYQIMKAEHAEMLAESGFPAGVIHCFSYSCEMAKLWLDMGFDIGIGGVLTFAKAKKLKDVAAYVPMERIVLETDCPYLAPVPFRGRRNDSTLLSYVVKALSEIRGISEEEVRRITWENACRLYRLPEA